MTSEELIKEGRALERPCAFLRPHGTGPVAAIWHERDDEEIESTGFHCWLTVDARQIPGLPERIPGYVSVLTDEERCQGGRVEIVESWPGRPGTELFARSESVLPPIDAVFAHGSEAVQQWLASNNWPRNERYNNNFSDKAVVAPYERVWFREYPLYREDEIYAVLGGWHWPGPDDDWHELVDDQLMVLTVRDSEPWVEAWHTRKGQFKVIQRIT